MWKFLTTTLLALGLWVSVAGVHAQTCGLRDNGDGTMTDPTTGLQIRKCAEGQSWAGNQCAGIDTKINFDEAVARYGRGVWRLMTVDEAKNLASKVKGCNMSGRNTWTSSPTGFGRNIHFFFFIDGVLDSQDSRDLNSVHLVRANQSSGNTSPSPPPQRPTPAQNSQQATAPVPPAAYNKPTRDRPDLMGYGCDVGQGSTVKNGCSEIINYVLCIVRHPDGRTTGPDTCQGGQIRPGILLPQDSRRVTFGEGSFDYLVAACKHPARPYNVRYIPGQGLSVSCGEF